MDFCKFGSKSVKKTGSDARRTLKTVKKTKVNTINQVGDQRVGSYSRVGYQERVQYCLC
jgi:hypothetical protein